MNLSASNSPLLAIGFLLVITGVTAEPAILDEKPCLDTAGLLIIGEIEQVTFGPQGLRLEARIDTGAETSSLGIISRQTFERDGTEWLRFRVNDPSGEEAVEFERPLVRTVEIKRHGAEPMVRAVVTLTLTIDNVEMEREFSLADRSKYEFPVLIGRNVLAGKYLVDVNRIFSTTRVGGREE